MGVVRNRVLSGHMAAATNQSKRSDYYAFIGKLGGLIKGIKKGLATASPEKRSMVSKAGVEVRKRLATDYFTYVVSTGESGQENKTREFRTRKPAREYKRELQEQLFRALITQYQYRDGVIIGRRVIR